MTSSGLKIWIWFPRQYNLPSPVCVPELYVSDPNTGAHRDVVGGSKVAAEGHFPLLFREEKISDFVRKRKYSRKEEKGCYFAEKFLLFTV